MMDMHTDQILTIRTPPPINEVRREPTFYLRALVLVMASCLTIGTCVLLLSSLWRAPPS